MADAQLWPVAFRWLDKRWGPHSVDLMASAVNHQLPRYISHLPDAGAFAVNLFLWAPGRDVALGLYCFPPVKRIGRVLQWAQQFDIMLTMVVPDWPSQPWWPLLLRHLCDVPVVMPPQRHLLTVPEGQLPEALQWTMIGCRLWFGSFAARAYQSAPFRSSSDAGPTAGETATTVEGERGLSIARAAESAQRIHHAAPWT